MTNLERLYKKVAEMKGVNKYQVEDIFKSQFDLVAKTMESMEDTSIRLPHIGVFLSNLKLKKTITERKKAKDERQQQD